MTDERLTKDAIMLTLAGSHLYGTNTPSSDIDIRGVCFSPIESLLGFNNFEQLDIKEPTEVGEFTSDDITVYSLQKFCRLALDANPNIIELLYVKDPIFEDWRWKLIRKNRLKFLSQKIRTTFVGYATSQLKRIQTYREWMKEAPIKPEPKEYGYIEDDDGKLQWTSSILKNTYENKLSRFQAYESWQKNRNPMRRKLEEEFGYDTKHASHLFRLLFEGAELLQDCYLALPMRDKQLKAVMSVREGQIDYEELIECAERGFNHLKKAPTSLPKLPDRDFINKLVIELELDRIADYGKEKYGKKNG